MFQETSRKEIRACNRYFPARLVIGFFLFQFRGARQQQQKSNNDSPSAGTIPASSLPQLFALFASRITYLMAEMWAHMPRSTALKYVDIVAFSINMNTTQSLWWTTDKFGFPKSRIVKLSWNFMCLTKWYRQKCWCERRIWNKTWKTARQRSRAPLCRQSQKRLSVVYSIAKPANIHVESIDWASALWSAYAVNLGVL